MKTAAAARAQVEGEEAAAREAERRVRGPARGRSGARSTASIAKYAQATVGERRREAVHVVEQVERVRDADEPDERDHDATTSFAISSTRSPLATTIPAAPNWATSFSERLQADDVVEQPGNEEEGAARRRSRAAAPVGSSTSTASETPIPARKPQKIPTPPKVGVGRSCQRSPVGTATSRSAERGAEQRAEDEVRHRQCGDGDGRAHAA